MSRNLVILALLLPALLAGGESRASADPPELRQSVADLANILERPVENRLSRRLDHYRRIRGHDVAIVTMRSKTRRHYDFWVQKRPELARGLVLMVDAEGGVELLVGSKLKSKFTQNTIARLSMPLDDPIRSDRFPDALTRRVDEAIGALAKDERSVIRRPSLPVSRVMAFFFFSSMLIFPWFGAVSARGQDTYGGVVAGIIVAIAMTLIAGPALGAMVLTVLGPLGFALDRIVTRHFRRSRQSNVEPAWWAGGGWF